MITTNTLTIYNDAGTWAALDERTKIKIHLLDHKGEWLLNYRCKDKRRTFIMAQTKADQQKLAEIARQQMVQHLQSCELQHGHIASAKIEIKFKYFSGKTLSEVTKVIAL